VLDRAPRINVSILSSHALRGIFTDRLDRILRYEHLEGSRGGVRYRVVHASERILIVRLAEVVLDELSKIAEIAATIGQQCMPAVVGERH
jgi:hypothetical protein